VIQPKLRMRVMGLRSVPRPFFIPVALLFAATLGAQDPVRPWLDWRTLETKHYRFHFPRELEPWARAAAERVESVDSAIASIVGWTSQRPVHVVVDDPYSISNGYALPFLDRPVSVWWATPPEPRTDVGDYRTWYEMLAVHELTHIAHLTRPSRNPFQRHIWESFPANLGPIAQRAPRWAIEGYATFVEGRITGTGRPNNVWRPAFLRQWAIEGRLPTYAQLSSWQDFNGSEFAYLGGSAFLEWLTQRQGDSSLALVWRRLTARRVRTFNAAFQGVYGDAPALLYGIETAELVRDAMAAKATLERAGLVQGELVQRLAWETGDPAISPDGSFVAVTLRDRERPSKIVVWQTTPERDDTAAIRRRIEMQKRDPLDVPDRRFYPIPKRALKTLRAINGRAFSQPRWFADNKRIIATRWAPRADATLTSDLYVWNTESGDVQRVTHGLSLSHADPHPNGREAIAMQCRLGHCDIFSVDLARGSVSTLLPGNPNLSYYRPRYSPDASRLAASANRGGLWEIVVANADGSSPRRLAVADSANRYDVQWLTPDSLIVVSERGGIPNLEVMSVETGASRTLTRVTGAALAPEVNRADSSVWFLSLHSLGLDLRRLTHRAARADSAVDISADKFGFAGVKSSPRVPLHAQQLPASRPYGAGPRHARWLPGAFASADGVGGALTIFTGDIVGRLNATATGALGESGTWQGGSLRGAWRFARPAIEFGAEGFIHEPSLARSAVVGNTLDASLVEAFVAASLDRRGDGWRYRMRVGAASGKLTPTAGTSMARRLGFAELGGEVMQSRGSTGLIEAVDLHASVGETSSEYQRALATFRMSTFGRDAIPFEAALTVGRVNGTPHPFELFTFGGATSPISDGSLLTQRYAMPEFQTGMQIGNRIVGWRVAIPGPWTWYLEGAGTALDRFNVERWQRAIGLETRFGLPIIPVAFSPSMRMRAGAAYLLDQPFKGRLRVYLETKYAP